MTRSQMIETVARKTGFTEAQVETTMDAMFDQIADCLRADEKVTIAGFGRFEMRPRKPKAYTNPKTKVSSRLESTSIPGFKASGRFKQKLEAGRPLLERGRDCLILHQSKSEPCPGRGSFCVLTSAVFHGILVANEKNGTRNGVSKCFTVSCSAAKPSTRPWSAWALPK